MAVATYHVRRNREGKTVVPQPIPATSIAFDEWSFEVWSNPADLAVGLSSLLRELRTAALEADVHQFGMTVEHLRGPLPQMRPSDQGVGLENGQEVAYEGSHPREKSWQHLYRVVLNSPEPSGDGVKAALYHTRGTFVESGNRFAEFIDALDALKGLEGAFSGFHSRFFTPSLPDAFLAAILNGPLAPVASGQAVELFRGGAVPVEYFWLLVDYFQRDDFRYAPPGEAGAQPVARYVRRKDVGRQRR